ncbi:MAG: response regulator [Bdellovibrio sp.]|nr:response regulator [Bdellovibrio sp.]
MQEVKQETKQDLTKYKILVVDDDDDLREIMFSIFKAQGFTVFEADNGKKAYEIVTSENIDMLISDIRMPGGDGLTLLEKVKSYNPTIPIVIFVTGFSDVSVSECIKKGAKNVFSKPFNQKELVSYVKESLGI